jgi:hypothetical protein
MAHGTLRDKTVLTGMAITASHIGLVLAGKTGYLFGNPGMTRTTGLFYHLHGDGQRLVRVFVAHQAGGDCLVFPMKGPAAGTLVAPGAVGHNLVVVVFSGTEYMVFPVTPGAVYLMLPPLLLDRLKNRKVALTALNSRKGLDVHVIG